MRLHYTNDGHTRFSMSCRNAERLVATAQINPETSTGISSGDVYRDDSPVFGHSVTAAIANKTTGGDSESIRIQCHPNGLQAFFPAAWLAKQIRLVNDAGPQEYSVPGRVIICIEPDEIHYAERAPGISDDDPLRP